MIESGDEQWVTKSVAAETIGVPLRTVQNWAKQRKVRTKGRLVDLAGVGALGGARVDTAIGATSADSVLAQRQPLREMARVGANGPPRQPSDGELSARLLKMFEDGANPIDASIEVKVPLERVRALHLEWKRAKEDDTSGPSVVERVAALERAWDDLQLQGLGHEVASLDAQLSRLKRQVADVGIPARSAFSCSHGTTGYFVLSATCSCCGEQRDFGFFTPQ